MTSYAARLETGRGHIQQDFIAFWFDGVQKHATPVRVKFPPHEPPRGSILEEFIVNALREQHADAPNVVLNGAVSLYGADREIVVGDGRVGSAVMHADDWRVYI